MDLAGRYHNNQCSEEKARFLSAMLVAGCYAFGPPALTAPPAPAPVPAPARAPMKPAAEVNVRELTLGKLKPEQAARQMAPLVRLMALVGGHPVR